MKKILLALPLLLLFAQHANAAPAMCGEVAGMNVSDPALTHSFIPIKGNGSFQGITGYPDVTKWVYHTKQGHMACEGCNGMPYDASLGILNPASTHIHFEWCWPDYATISGPIVFPMRVRAFHLLGGFYENGGPLIQNVVWDDPLAQDSPQHFFAGDPMGVVSKTAHATYNPLSNGDGGPPIHGPVPNGWSIMQMSILAAMRNGNYLGITGQTPIFTLMDPNVPENPLFTPSSSAGTGITSVIDGGSAPWGSQITECRICVFPFLADYNLDWALDNVFGYMYGGTIPAGGIGETSDCEDMDLHNGILGNCLPGMPANSNGPGFLPSSTPGRHTRTLIWHATTGPNGILAADGVTFIGHPNQDVWALDGFNIEIGTPPVQTECRKINAKNFAQPLPCVAWDDTVITPPPPIDVCPNIPGVQTSVPAGLVLINGQCVAPPPPPCRDFGSVGSLTLARCSDSFKGTDSTDGKVVPLGTFVLP